MLSRSAVYIYSEYALVLRSRWSAQQMFVRRLNSVCHQHIFHFFEFSRYFYENFMAVAGIRTTGHIFSPLLFKWATQTND